MGRIMTLRGSYDAPIGTATTFGRSGIKQVFDYESANRTRGWKVKYARVWIQEATGGTTGGDSRLLLQVSLATDEISEPSGGITNAATARDWQGRIGAGDNRTIAWASLDYQNRDNTSADFVVAAPGAGNGDLLVDADRVITNELWICSYGVTEASSWATPGAGCNYYIELEEVKLSPKESILQQIKGIGQDIDN